MRNEGAPGGGAPPLASGACRPGRCGDAGMPIYWRARSSIPCWYSRTSSAPAAMDDGRLAMAYVEEHDSVHDQLHCWTIIPRNGLARLGCVLACLTPCNHVFSSQLHGRTCIRARRGHSSCRRSSCGCRSCRLRRHEQARILVLLLINH